MIVLTDVTRRAGSTVSGLASIVDGSTLGAECLAARGGRADAIVIVLVVASGRAATVAILAGRDEGVRAGGAACGGTTRQGILCAGVVVVAVCGAIAIAGFVDISNPVTTGIRAVIVTVRTTPGGATAIVVRTCCSRRIDAGKRAALRRAGEAVCGARVVVITACGTIAVAGFVGVLDVVATDVRAIIIIGRVASKGTTSIIVEAAKGTNFASRLTAFAHKFDGRTGELGIGTLGRTSVRAAGHRVTELTRVELAVAAEERIVRGHIVCVHVVGSHVVCLVVINLLETFVWRIATRNKKSSKCDNNGSFHRFSTSRS